MPVKMAMNRAMGSESTPSERAGAADSGPQAETSRDADAVAMAKCAARPAPSSTRRVRAPSASIHRRNARLISTDSGGASERWPALATLGL